jgi:hypothetical protein
MVPAGKLAARQKGQLTQAAKRMRDKAWEKNWPCIVGVKFTPSA